MANILVVEDNKSLQILLRETLAKEKHTVMTADDGVDGLAIFQENVFDLVVTDIMMPRMDGIEFIQAIRKEKTNAGIIALSGGDNPATGSLLETARLMGAHVAIKKPFKRQELLDAVAAALTTAAAASANKEGKKR